MINNFIRDEYEYEYEEFGNDMMTNMLSDESTWCWMNNDFYDIDKIWIRVLEMRSWESLLEYYGCLDADV